MPLPIAVIVHSLAHAEAALRAAARLGAPITLRSPAGAAAYMGPSMFLAIVAAARAACPGARDVDIILDCADRAGDALAALRQGVPAIRFCGRADVAAKLHAIAAARGQRVTQAADAALDLLDQVDPEQATAAWIARARGAAAP